jgi:hypothetical protein
MYQRIYHKEEFAAAEVQRNEAKLKNAWDFILINPHRMYTSVSFNSEDYETASEWNAN